MFISSAEESRKIYYGFVVCLPGQHRLHLTACGGGTSRPLCKISFYDVFVIPPVPAAGDPNRWVAVLKLMFYEKQVYNLCHYQHTEKGKIWVESPILGAKSDSFLGTTCAKHIMKVYNIVYQQLME